MNHYIVLVKQVPDVSRISDSAFNPQTGTLIRSKLPNVINQLDTYALTAALQMKKISQDNDAKIICLTMGPPHAKEVLHYGLSRGANEAILLTDKKFSGADTRATAYTLHLAIKKIRKELCQDQNCYILSGMQSIDGDTAQVPAQIATALGLTCISNITEIQYHKNKFHFIRRCEEACQKVVPLHTSAVLTIAQHDYPLFASFSAARKALHTPIIQWDAEEIHARKEDIGVKGSKTKVVHIYSPLHTKRKCQQVDNIERLAHIIHTEAYKQHTDSKDTKTRLYKLPKNRDNLYTSEYDIFPKEKIDHIYNTLKEHATSTSLQDEETLYPKMQQEESKPLNKKIFHNMLQLLHAPKGTYSGQVWVVAESHHNKINTTTLELLGKARELADSLMTETGIIFLGTDVSKVADELFAYGADYIYSAEHTLLNQFDPIVWNQVISDIIFSYKPQITLFNATSEGRILAPMVAYTLECGLTADCTSLSICDNILDNQIAILLQTRPAIGGNIMADICTKDSFCQMATVRPGIARKIQPDYSRKGTILPYAITLTDKDRSTQVITSQKRIQLFQTDADVIIGGGKGMQNRNRYDALLNMLSSAIQQNHNVKVEHGASRRAVEHGFAQQHCQIGQTGVSVRPNLYIALGISGAIQHMIAVSQAQKIIAVNNDPNAAIFKQADYYYIGNVEEITPKVVEILKTR